MNWIIFSGILREMILPHPLCRHKSTSMNSQLIYNVNVFDKGRLNTAKDTVSNGWFM